MKTWFYSILFLLTGISLGQNLILNPSFEDFYPCPTEPSTLDNPIEIAQWFSPTKGTPDVFSGCAYKGKMDVPKNMLGHAVAHEGISYVGLILARPWDEEDKYYREFLETELVKPLLPNKTYQVSFAFRPALYSAHEIKKINVALSNDRLEYPDGDIIGKFTFMEVPVETAPVDGDTGWSLGSLTFKAQGGEKFLVFGDFSIPNKENYIPRKLTRKNANNGCYYLFDSFDLRLIPQATFPIDSVFSLPTLHFETNSSVISDSEIIDIEALAEFLHANDKFNIKIIGHTDKVGSHDYNLVLSEKRAIAVKNELIRMGIAEGQIEAAGYGKQRLISGDDANNRRVEFLIKERSN